MDEFNIPELTMREQLVKAMTQWKYAVVYCRYSSERQNDQSIESQLRICKEFAEKNNIKIVGTYIDKAMTGTNDNRPSFQKMLADSEKSKAWDIVLVKT